MDGWMDLLKSRDRIDIRVPALQGKERKGFNR